MDIKDYLKAFGKSFMKSASSYSKHKPSKEKSVPYAFREEEIIPPKQEPENVQQQSTRVDYEKEFIKTFKKLTYKYRLFDVWSDFITMFACAISNAVDKSHYDEREKMYLKTINKYSKDEQMLFPELVAETVMALEENQEQDFLGNIYTNLGLGNKSTSQFFTSYHICQFIAAASISDIKKEIDEKGYITISDPCCGAGAILIAGVNEVKKQLEKIELNFQNHVLIAAQDIDYTVAMMCYIQLSLLGVAAYIKVGNSLTEPMSSTDTLENYWFTPMYFSKVWSTRRMFKKMDSIIKGEGE